MEESGKFTSNYQINTPTNRPPSASLTVYSTPTSTKCTFPACQPHSCPGPAQCVSTSSIKLGLQCSVPRYDFGAANVDMINLFEVFLPQLLRYPNPADPLNGDAAVLLLREPKNYEAKVRDYVLKYATKEAVEEMEHTDDSDYEMSDPEMSDEEEEEPAGQMELC